VVLKVIFFLQEILRRLSFAEPEIPSLAASLVDRCISVLRSHPSTDPLPVLYEAKAFLRLPSVANLKIGIVTSSRRRLIEACLLHISFEHEIGCLIAREDCPKLKPAADPVLKCLETLGVCPADAIMIGDGRKDIEAARAACLQKAFLIAPPPKQDGPHDINSFGADVVIHSFRELAEKLEMPWEDALN